MKICQRCGEESDLPFHTCAAPAATEHPAIKGPYYYVTIEPGYRWLGQDGSVFNGFVNRHFWPSAEAAQAAQAALDCWLDQNPTDPAYARLRLPTR